MEKAEMARVEMKKSQLKINQMRVSLKNNLNESNNRKMLLSLEKDLPEINDDQIKILNQELEKLKSKDIK